MKKKSIVKDVDSNKQGFALAKKMSKTFDPIEEELKNTYVLYSLYVDGKYGFPFASSLSSEEVKRIVKAQISPSASWRLYEVGQYCTLNGKFIVNDNLELVCEVCGSSTAKVRKEKN